MPAPTPSILRRFLRPTPARLTLLLVLLTLIFRLLWGHFAHRRLHSLINAARARGEPTKFADLDATVLPDDENLATALRRASANLAQTPMTSSTLVYRDGPPYPADWMALAKASVSANAPALAALRESRKFSRAQFAPPVTQRNGYFNRAAYYDPGELADVAYDAALYAHVTGDDAEALRRIVDLLHLAAALRQDPFEISNHRAGSVDRSACMAILVIGPGLRPEGRAAWASLSKDIIRRLLDDGDVLSAYRRTLLGHRVFAIDYALHEPHKTWALRPLLDADLADYVHDLDLDIAAAACRDWPAVRQLRLSRVANRGQFSRASIRRYSRWFGIEYPGGDDGLIRRFADIAERRLAAAALAMHLFRLDHGRFPESLGRLVPAYLPAVPVDPFHADGRAIGFVTAKTPDGQPRPMLYFEPDPTDQVPPEPTYAGFSLRKRQYRDLTRFAPPPSPAQPNPD